MKWRVYNTTSARDIYLTVVGGKPEWTRDPNGASVFGSVHEAYRTIEKFNLQECADAEEAASVEN